MEPTPSQPSAPVQAIPTPPVVPPTTPPSHSKLPWILLVVVLLLAFTTGGLYFGKQMSTPVSVVPTPAPVAVVPTVVADPTANWQATTTDQMYVPNHQELSYQFSLKTPSGWQTISHSSNFPNESLFGSQDNLMNLSIAIQQNFNSKTGKPYTTLDEFTGVPLSQTLMVMGQHAEQVLPRAGSENENKVFLFSEDQKIIISIDLKVGDNTISDPRVTQESIGQGQQIFDQILSTFKFTNSTSTSNLKTITFEKLSFQVPATWWNGGVGTDQKTNEHYMVLNPTQLPAPSDAIPAFFLTQDDNIAIAQKIEVLKTDYGLTDMSQQTTTIGGLNGVILHGTSAPGGQFGSQKLAWGIVQAGSDVYYLQDYGSISTHEADFTQILNSFKITN